MPDRRTIDHATIAHDRYGLVCPDCGMPKTKQALRCRSCWRDLRPRTRRVRRPTKSCLCGAAIWATSTRCRPCYRRQPQSTPTPASYRAKHRALNDRLFGKAA